MFASLIETHDGTWFLRAIKLLCMFDEKTGIENKIAFKLAAAGRKKNCNRKTCFV